MNKKLLPTLLAVTLLLSASGCGFFSFLDASEQSEASVSQPDPPSLSEVPSVPDQEQESSLPESGKPSSSIAEAPSEPTVEAAPEAVAADFLKAYKAWDEDAFNRHLLHEYDMTEDLPAELQGSLRQIAARMEYTVGNSRVDGEDAYVSVKIVAVDTTQAVGDISKAIIKVIAQKKLTGQSIDDPSVLFGSAMDAVQIEKLPTFTTETDIHLELDADAGQWKLDLNSEANNPLYNALLGGLPDLLAQLEELADSYGLDF